MGKKKDYDGGSYENYSRTTVDAGPWLFYSTVTIVILLFLSILPLVWAGRKWKKFRKARKRAKQTTQANAAAAFQDNKVKMDQEERYYKRMNDASGTVRKDADETEYKELSDPDYASEELYKAIEVVANPSKTTPAPQKDQRMGKNVDSSPTMDDSRGATARAQDGYTGSAANVDSSPSERDNKSMVSGMDDKEPNNPFVQERHGRNFQDDLLLRAVDEILDPYVYEDDTLRKISEISHFDENGTPGANQIDIFETTILDAPQERRTVPGRKGRAPPPVVSFWNAAANTDADDTMDMSEDELQDVVAPEMDYARELDSDYDSSGEEDAKDEQQGPALSDFGLFVRDTTRGWETFRAVFSCDTETRKIMRLAIPATFSSISSSIFGAITTALIARNAGPEAFTAYSMVGVFLGLTDSLTSGVSEAEGILTAQAIGMQNGFLAGQYTQLSFLVYVIVAIPMYFIWIFVADEVIFALGMSETVVALTREYIPIAVFSYIGSGISSGLETLLWSAGFGGWLTGVDTVYSLFYLLAIAITAIIVDPLELSAVAWIGVGYAVLYGSFVFSTAKYSGMLDPYWKGLVKRFSLMNFNLVSGVLKMAVPLSFGTLMSTGEWEILTFFAAKMGGAEVAAWYIAGAIWSVFEYAPAGFGTAAEIRIGYHLGDSNPRMAKLAAYKSLLYAGVWSTLMTLVFTTFHRSIMRFFTSDPTLFDLLEEGVPLMAVGNVLCCLGNEAYSIISAQGRPKLCTRIYLAGTWLVVLPLSGYLVLYKNYGLPAIIASVVISYGTIAVCFLYVVFTSNWSKLSKKVIAKAKQMEAAEKAKVLV